MSAHSNPTPSETPQERYERLKADGNGQSGDFTKRQAAARDRAAPAIDAASVIFHDVVPAKGYCTAG